MKGYLPHELSNLSALTKLDFSDNEISANIPQAWSNLEKLGKFQMSLLLVLDTTHNKAHLLFSVLIESLDLTYNDMSGHVPDAICSLKRRQLNSFLRLRTKGTRYK